MTTELRRKIRTRAKIRGTAMRPRLSVFRSNVHIYAQLINDEANMTIASAGSLELKKKGAQSEQAREVGALIAKRAIEKGIKTAVFDRGAYRYHGIVKFVAESARKGGLQF